MPALRTHSDKNIHDILEEKKRNRKTKKHTKKTTLIRPTTAASISGPVISVSTGPAASPESGSLSGTADLGYVLHPAPAFIAHPAPLAQPAPATQPAPVTQESVRPPYFSSSSENPQLPTRPLTSNNVQSSGSLSVTTQGNFESQLSNDGNLITISPGTSMNSGSITLSNLDGSSPTTSQIPGGANTVITIPLTESGSTIQMTMNGLTPSKFYPSPFQT